MSIKEKLLECLPKDFKPARIERLCSFLALLEGSDEIRNVDFKDLKTAFDFAYDRWRSDFTAYASNVPLYLYNLPGFLRKNPVHRNPNSEMWCAIAEMIQAAKVRVVKRRAPSGDGKPLLPPVVISSRVREMFDGVLNDITKETLVEFEKQMIEVYRRAAKKVWDELQSQGVVSIIEIYQKKIAMNPEWMSLFFKNRSIVKSFPREKVEESSKAMAARDAVAVREEFIYKSHNKITPLLNLKPLREITRAAVSVRRESIDSSITFLFDDESRFTVRTQIVWVFGRVNSRPFARYPMTFHDVFVSGEKMKLPSELKVREAFMKEDSNEAR